MKEKNLGVIMIKFIESELRRLEGDVILNQMEQNSLPDPTLLISQHRDSVGDDASGLVEILRDCAKLIANMYHNEGLYEAYNKVLNVLIEFKENNENNNNEKNKN